MNTNNIVVMHKVALSKIGTTPVLREGSSVYVKILNKLSNTSYIASFAGDKFKISSTLNLVQGQSFIANIKLKDSKVLLVPLINEKSQNINQKILDTKINNLGIIQDTSINSFLSKLGLIPDGLSFIIFQELKNLGIKFDINLINKIRNLSIKFKGKEKEAILIALSLEQKGIKSSETLIKDILLNNNEENKEKLVFSDKLNNNQKSSQDIIEVFKSFFANIFKGNFSSFNTGTLTVYNHLNSKDLYYSSWIRVPFEFIYNIQENSKEGNGVINILLNSKLKKVEKVVAKYNFDFTEGTFALLFNNNKCEKIKFNLSNMNELNINKITKNLKENYKDINISYEESLIQTEIDFDINQLSFSEGVLV